MEGRRSPSLCAWPSNPTQVLTQIASVLIVLVYSAVATFVILKALGAVMPLRVEGRDEKMGLDVSDHGEEAYTHGDGAILVKPKVKPMSQGATDVDVVTLYLLPSVNRELKPVLLKGLKPGARVVSHDFDMGDCAPDQKVEVGNRTVFFWRIPEKKS